MAAFATEGANLVWQRVNNMLEGNPTSATGTTSGASPAAQWAFRDLKRFLATQKGNPPLGFYNFSNLLVDDANGQLLATGAANVYAVYGKKLATGIDVFLWAIDDVDDDSTITTKGLIMQAYLNSADEAFTIYPNGLAFGLGLVMKAYTAPPGVADSTDVDCPSGFVITG
jgi:hypothetical protein